MPEELERDLKRRAKALKRVGRLKDEDAYIYGTLRKTGWKPRRENPSPATRARKMAQIKAMKGMK